MPVRSSMTVPPDLVVGLLGSADENLSALESGLAAEIHVRGNAVNLSGAAADVALAERVISELIAILAGGQALSPDAVRRSIAMVSGADNASPAEVLTLDILSRRGKTIRPKTLNQKRYVDAIDANTIVFGIGPAGTGKTYLAVALAVSLLNDRRVKRIILARPAVEAGERLGFLPGDIAAKVDPYLRPLYDALYDMIEPHRAERLVEQGTIEVAPLAFMRGRTLDHSFMILDEAQNTTSEQMKMFLTRIGFHSKAVVTGDVTQIDLPTEKVSGLVEARNVVAGIPGIEFIEFDERDVVRHPLVQRIIRAYDRHDAGRENGAGEPAGDGE